MIFFSIVLEITKVVLSFLYKNFIAVSLQQIALQFAIIAIFIGIAIIIKSQSSSPEIDYHTPSNEIASGNTKNSQFFENLYLDDTSNIKHYLLEKHKKMLVNTVLDEKISINNRFVSNINEENKNQILINTSLLDNQSIDVNLQLNTIE